MISLFILTFTVWKSDQDYDYIGLSALDLVMRKTITGMNFGYELQTVAGSMNIVISTTRLVQVGPIN